jgi:PKD repeat protein
VIEITLSVSYPVSFRLRSDLWLSLSIGLAFSLLMCCVPFVDAEESWVLVTEHAGWSQRELHSSVVTLDGSIVVMGGWDQTVHRLNDVWKSTDNGKTWTMMNASAGWSRRDQHNSVALPDGSIVLLGGNDILLKNDVWRSTDDGTTWTLMNASAGWTPRAGHNTVVMPDGSIVLMGGADDYNHRCNDTWRSTDNGATWTQMTDHAKWSGRIQHKSIVFPDGSIILMGGDDIEVGYLNDTWRSTDNGATWTQMTEHAKWPARVDYTSVAMPDGSIILMGGVGWSYLNDTWRSTDNGATWTQMTEHAKWSARQDLTSVVMPDGSIILMGGGDVNGLRNDVWRWMPSGSTIHTDFKADPVSGSAPLTVQFNDTSTGSPTSWSWDFGDGGTSTDQNPSYAYTIAGNFTISLTATNPQGGDTKVKTDYITVTAPMQYTFSTTEVLEPPTDTYWNRSGFITSQNVERWLGDKAGWKLIFNKSWANVTKADFGTDGGGLDNATLHWHVGHGGTLNDGTSFIGLQDYPNSYLPASVVEKKWGGKNKWVVLISCEVLSDENWGKALSTSHGILGFNTSGYNDPQLPTEFFHNAMEENRTLSDSWYQATTKQFGKTPVCTRYLWNNEGPVADYVNGTNISISAGVRFKTIEQLKNDHLPGYGVVAPDGDANSNKSFPWFWNCSEKEV